jgi:hypothetical protein
MAECQDWVVVLLHIYRSREFIFTAWIQHFFVSKSAKASSYQSCVLYTVQSYIYIYSLVGGFNPSEKY